MLGQEWEMDICWHAKLKTVSVVSELFKAIIDFILFQKDAKKDETESP
jgi:hypothetical protein